VTRVCVSVCLSAAACPNYCTDPGVPWGSGRGCPLVVHYWANLQSVHGLRCYGDITRTRKHPCTRYMSSSISCGFVVRQPVYKKINSKSTTNRKLYNKSATNPQHLDMSRCCTTNRRLQQVYNTSRTNRTSGVDFGLKYCALDNIVCALICADIARETELVSLET